MSLFIQLAGLLHFVIASTNFFAARLFRYRDNMRRVDPFVGEVFWVQNVFIVLTTVSLGLLCLKFPHDLAGGSALGRSLCGFLCFFWGIRLGVQLFFYDAQIKSRFRLGNWAFTLIFIYMTGVFSFAFFTQKG